MIAVVRPSALQGTVHAPSSKSCAHRLLIAAALSDAPCEIRLNADSEDIRATARCLRALGAAVTRTDAGYQVTPPDAYRRAACELDCGESGSTLRFLMPVAAALGVPARFTGHGRLPERPNRALTDALRVHGAEPSGDLLPLTLSGRLRGGVYEIAGNISSQYITGLMLALPLCAGDSEIRLTTALESASYVDITLNALAEFGVRVDRTECGWRVPGGQRYHSPGRTCAEGDWSSAAFFITAARLGARVTCDGLREDSAQGDRKIGRLLDQLGGAIDVSDTPDLVPALAVAAAVHPGVTRITGAARLRLKESDRLEAVMRMLTALGGRCEAQADGLTIEGVPRLTGGRVDGRNDHRIVMAAAIAACRADGDVEITDAQAVGKSWPEFFEVYRALGGSVIMRDA